MLVVVVREDVEVVGIDGGVDVVVVTGFELVYFVVACVLKIVERERVPCLDVLSSGVGSVFCDAGFSNHVANDFEFGVLVVDAIGTLDIVGLRGQVGLTGVEIEVGNGRIVGLLEHLLGYGVFLSVEFDARDEDVAYLVVLLAHSE